MTWLELGTSGPTAFTGEAQLMSRGWKAPAAHGGCRFLPREYISLNSLVEIGPPDGILCISPTPHLIRLLPTVLPSVAAIMGRLINIWSSSLRFFFFFFYPALWMHISIKHVVGGGRCARVKIHAGLWRQRSGACERMVDAFLRVNYGWHIRVRIGRCVNLRTR